MLGASSASGALHSGSRAACTFTSTLAVSPGSHVSSAVFGDKAAGLICLLRVKRPVLAARPNSRQLHAAASAGSLLQLSWHMTCESPCMPAGMNNLIIHPCHRNKNNQMAVSAAPHTLLLYFALSPATCSACYSLPQRLWRQALRAVQRWHLLAQWRMRGVPCAGHVPVNADVLPAHAAVSLPCKVLHPQSL